MTLIKPNWNKFFWSWIEANLSGNKPILPGEIDMYRKRITNLDDSVNRTQGLTYYSDELIWSKEVNIKI